MFSALSGGQPFALLFVSFTIKSLSGVWDGMGWGGMGWGGSFCVITARVIVSIVFHFLVCLGVLGVGISM